MTDRRSLAFTLPEPPSANAYWRHVGDKVLLSREARQYGLDARAAFILATNKLQIAFPVEPLKVTLTWYRSRASGDLDNRIKQALDGLNGTAYVDDQQIVELHAYRREAPKAGRLDVLIEIAA